MSFVRKQWRNNPPSSATPITADELNRIEAGIERASNPNRNILSHDPIDLNDVGNDNVSGSYSVRQAVTINGPDVSGFNLSNSNFLWFLDVLRAGSNGRIQIMYPADPGISGYYYRVTSYENPPFKAWQYLTTRSDMTELESRIDEALSRVSSIVSEIRGYADRVETALPVVESVYDNALIAQNSAESAERDKNEILQLLSSIETEGFNEATPNVSGLMSSEDKVKLDVIEVVNVDAYGAVGNGTTNDFNAIQEAIDSTPEYGTLRFPANKSYSLGSSGPLMISKPITIDSANLLIQNTGAIRSSSSDVTVQNVTVTDIQNTDKWPGQVGTLDFRGTDNDNRLSNVRVLNCEIFNAIDRGIMMSWVDGFRIEDSFVDGYGYTGFWLTRANNGIVRGNTIHNATPYSPDEVSSGPYGIAITDVETTTESQSKDIVVSENIVRFNARVGLDTHGGKNIHFVNNQVYSCDYGITMTAGSASRGNSPENIVIMGNLIDGLGVDGTHGIRIGGVPVEQQPASSSAMVTNNIIRGVSQSIVMYENRPIDRFRSVIRDNAVEVFSRWVDPHDYDSGWRDITMYNAPDDLTDDSIVRIRRVGYQLHIAFRVWFKTPDEQGGFLSRELPVGWLPVEPVHLWASRGGSNLDQRVLLYASGALQWRNGFNFQTGEFLQYRPTKANGSSASGSFVVPALDDLPTELIGDPWLG